METANNPTVDPTQHIAGQGNVTEIPVMESGGVASLATMQNMPDSFDVDELASMGNGPTSLQPMEDILPHSSEPQPVVSPDEPNPAEAGGKDPVKDASYWQSQHDKKEHEHQLELAQVKNDALQSQLAQQNQPDNTPAPEPVAPSRPQDFDAFEAYNTPESESYKWRVSDEQQAVTAIESKAMQLAGNDATKQKAFIDFMNSSESYSIDFMYQAFQAKQNGNQTIPSTTQQTFDQNLRNNQMPNDPGVVAGQAPQVVNDQDKFNQGRQAMGQKVNY